MTHTKTSNDKNICRLFLRVFTGSKTLASKPRTDVPACPPRPLIPDVFTANSRVLLPARAAGSSHPSYSILCPLLPVKLFVMNHFTKSDHKQVEPGSQPRAKIPLNPTVQQMRDWDQVKLLQWIPPEETKTPQ